MIEEEYLPIINSTLLIDALLDGVIVTEYDELLDITESITLTIITPDSLTH